MQIIKEKEWALELNQAEFDIEFQKRNPFCDSIPSVDKYLNTENPQTHGIDSFNLEDLEVEQTQVEREKEERKEAVLYCRGCKKEFNNPISKWANKKVHEKTCKTLLAMKL